MLTDLSIVTYGTNSAEKDLYAYCVQSFRKIEPRIKFCFKPTINTIRDHLRVYNLTNKNKKIEKEQSSWDCCFISNVPLHKTVSYFELSIHGRGYDGIFVGVTDDVEQTSQGPINAERTCAFYNYASGNFSNREIVVPTSIGNLFSQPYIVGVVIDRIVDKIQFYVNGKYFTSGTKSPSEFKELYAFVSVYYKKQTIEVCEKYGFYSLQRPLVFSNRN